LRTATDARQAAILLLPADRASQFRTPLQTRTAIFRVKQTAISDAHAKLTVYRAFIEGELEAPRHLVRRVHQLYFDPQHEEFAPRTMWSLQNAFTSAFKQLDPISQFKAAAKLGSFLQMTGESQ